MENEVQLIVRRGGNINVLSQSNAPTLGAVGSQRIIVPAFNNQSSIVGTTVTLINALGETNTRFCNSINADTPTPGFTRLNFNFPVFSFDFTLAAGGYFVWGDEKEYYVDLYPLESISQNFNFQDVGTFAPLGDFTREFRVPASDRNTEVFGLLDSFTFSDSGNVYGTKIPAEIRVNTLPIMRGHLRVIKTFKKNDLLGDIQLSFYGEAPDLFRAVGDKLLADLEILPEAFNQIIDYNNTINPPNPGELCWGLVERGQKWDNMGGGRPITNSEQPIFPADLTPFFNAWTIFYNIIREAGFTIAPTPLETILSGYWCPWINSKNVITIETVANYYFSAGFTSATSVTDDNFFTFPALVDNGGAYGLAGYFEAPVEGFYSFRFWANVVPVGTFGPSTGGIKFYLFTGSLPLSGTIVVNYEVAVSGFDQNNGVRQRILFTTTPIYMLAGQRIKPYSEFTGTPLFLGDASNNPLEGTGWELFSYYRNWGDTFNASANAPNIKQVDFVKDILAMHAAVLIPSRSTPNEVTIFPIADYLATGDTLNWTQKMDIEKDLTLSPTTDIQKRNFLWSYKNGGDMFSKLFTDNGRTYGEYKILNGYSVAEGAPVNEFVTGALNVRLTAESTPAAYVNGTTIPIPKFINDKSEFVAPNLRFLFLADLARLPMYDDGADAVTLGDINIFNHYSSVNASVGDYDLNFNPETPLHAITTNPFRNLFNEYWREYLNGLYNPEARILEAYFALELSDILTFQYNDRIFIKDSYWRIIEISDYKVGLNESTKVKLIKLVEPAPDCELIPTTVVINEDMTQSIEFTDFEGEPQPATAACCIRYGYTWEESLNQCLAYGTPIVTDPGGGSDFRMMNAGQNGMPSNVVAITSNTNISPDNTFSVFVGENISVEKGNQNTLAVGERLKMEGENRASSLLGRNAYTNIMGLHFGGGDRVSDKEGNQQTGVIVLSNSFAFTAAGQTLELVPGNDTITRINLPDGTSITALYVLQASDMAGNAYYETGSLFIEKIGGVTVASSPIQITTDASGTTTFVLSIDIATDPDEHRFKVTSAGTGFPVLSQVILTLYYTQTR
jgi:hypothetical protein